MSTQPQIDALKGAVTTVKTTSDALEPGPFSAAQATALVAQAGAVVAAANNVAIEEPPPIPPAGSVSAVRLSPVNPQTPFGGYGFQFCHACMMPNGKIHHVWDGTWELDTINKTASRVKSGPPNKPENFGVCFVPGENAVYNGDGGPDAAVDVVHAGRYDVAANSYANSIPAGTTGDASMLFDPARNRLLSFGGWTPGAPTSTLQLGVAGAPWVFHALANPPVCLPETGSGMTYARSGMLANGTCGVFDNNREIKEWDGVASAYVTRPTTGPKPPRHSVGTIVNDAYVFFCGYDEIVWGAGSESSDVNVLYVCPRSTWVWTAYTTPAAVTPRPSSGLIPVADHERNRLILLISAGFVEAWAFVVPG